jgi:peptide/nickel transport system ATP-binding protein
VSGQTPILRVRNLTARLGNRREAVHAVRGISFDIYPGEAVGFVGESGCGKSVTARAIMRLAPEGTSVSLGGSVDFMGRDLLQLSEGEMRNLRGRRIAMVFQDPMSSINPVMTVGSQIDDILRRHMGLSGKAARRRTVELLSQVGIADPERRADAYPHQFSGGMRQRVVVALALCTNPRLIVADEPTTALDVSIQAQIIALLRKLCREHGTAILLITHDMGVIAETATRVAVMYAGRIVEIGPVRDVIKNPRHPYTVGLMGAIPTIGHPVDRLVQIDGTMPRLTDIPPGCPFNPRCPHAWDRCRIERPDLLPAGTSRAACWLHDHA